MDIKLTLTLEKEIIEKAKAYAKLKGRSLSDLVESYFKIIVTTDKKNDEITPFIKSLKGSIKAPKDFDYKKVLENELAKKYLK